MYNVTKEARWYRYALVLAVLFWVPLFSIFPSSATDSTYYLDGSQYEGDENSSHDLSSSVSSFSYGADSIGKMAITGDIHKSTTYDGRIAYGVNDNISFRYIYSGGYQDSKNGQWFLKEDKSKTVAGIQIKTIKKGAVIIQSSHDGMNWNNACEPIYDFFDKYKKNGSTNVNLYTTTKDEIKVGTYYRVIVAYEIWQQTKDEFFDWDDEYNKRICTEVYEFYVCSDLNYVIIRDISDRTPLQDNAIADKGFYIDWSGSAARVYVEKDGVPSLGGEFNSYRTDKGKYSITITTMLGEEYKKNIEVSKGTVFTSIKPEVFESKDGEGYPENGRITGKNCLNLESYTGINIGTRYGYNITQSTYNGILHMVLREIP